MKEAAGIKERFEETMVIEHKEVNEDEEEEEDEDDDGPPPGFDCIALQTETQKDIAGPCARIDKIEEEEEEDDDDIDGPPPGWSPIAPASQPNQTPVQLTNSQHSDVEMREKHEVLEDDDEDDGPPPGWDLVPPTSQGAETVPSDRENGSHQQGVRSSDEGTQPGHKSVPPSQMLPPTTSSQKSLAPSTQEKGQMVCGSCRKLLSYPRGVKYVQCSCCQTVNLVLEAHQVGQVKCGGCAVLLMYPDGAPSVKCCSCRYVTDIGAHNRRPPLSVQQARRLPFLNPIH